MLTITHINYIRDLYFSQGKNYNEICKITGRNFRTVKKYVMKEDFNEKKHKVGRPNKTDVLRPVIRKWLTEDKSRHHKQRHTAKRIYDRLKEEHPELLQVGERRVRDIVKEERDKIFSEDKAYLKLEHPGGEAQVDFGTFEGYEDNILKKFHHLILSFPKSNAGFALVTRSQTREALLEGLVEIFAHIGHVPNAIWFDQMSTATLRKRDENGQVKTADFVLRFANHYGFKVKFCNPNSGNEKGNVENMVGTIRRNFFVPEPKLDNLKTFNQKLLGKCKKKNQENHYRLKRPIQEIFEEEKGVMNKFKKIPFDTARYETRRVNKYGLVEFEGSSYSANPRYVGQNVILKIMANELTVYSKDLDKKVSDHPRLFEKGQESIKHLDFIDMVKLRPRALKYSGIYGLLPESWQAYLENQDKESLKEAFNILKEILLEDDLAYADKVMKEALKHGSQRPEALRITYKRLKENRSIYQDKIYLPNDLPFLEVDIGEYDKLLGGFRI